MSVVLIGGHDRMHSEYKGIGKKNGLKLKVFTQITPKFSKNIGNPDAIVLFTNTVSHKMVNIAIKEAKRKNIPITRSHTSSSNSLNEILQELKNTAC